MILDDQGLRLLPLQRLLAHAWLMLLRTGIPARMPITASIWLWLYARTARLEIRAASLSYRLASFVIKLFTSLVQAVMFIPSLAGIVIGTFVGYWLLITRFYLGEFLITFSIVGWSLLSLSRAIEPHGLTAWTQAVGYLS